MSMNSVGEDFPNEQRRVRELLQIYQNLGPIGRFGALMIEGVLRKAEAAQSSGDAVAILSAYAAMKECK